MANTYSQIYIQIVFAVKFRQNLIHEDWEVNLYKYITGIILHKGQNLLIVNGMPDHIHILIAMKPSCCLSDLVREIKKSSTQYIIDNQLSRSKFQWQEGYGAFSYSQSDLSKVIKYINNQKKHHHKSTFKEEYERFVKQYKIDYDERYLFE